MRIIPQNEFDRDLDINQLLKNINLKKLSLAINDLLGNTARVTDTNNNVIVGNRDLNTGLVKVPLVIELEPVAYLEGKDSAKLKSVAILIEQLLKSSERYIMASELQIESVHADYEKIQKKNKELIASEEKYKELSENLEKRVQEQITTIESSQRQLYQAEKQASVGQLAAGVAHEINNPISFIRSNLATADEYVESINNFARILNSSSDGDSLHHKWKESDLDFVIEDFSILLKESIDGADRVKKIVSDLKDFSDVDSAEVSVANLNDVIRTVANVSENQITQKAELELDLNDIPAIECQPGYLSQVFLNMIQNSAQAIKQEHGRIRISSGFIEDQIVIKIQDNGCGMSPDTAKKIFDPFYTSKEVGSGTGLGLTVSLDIVNSHNGLIKVESQEGKGTTFIITLPVKE